jgi:hypothetical protein
MYLWLGYLYESTAPQLSAGVPAIFLIPFCLTWNQSQTRILPPSAQPLITMAVSASSSNPITPPSNYGQFITVKLTRDNYLLWQAQIQPYLRSQRLLGYVTGDLPCPSKTLPAPEKDAPPVLNPTYDQWVEQDQAILSAILSSLSPEVLSRCLFLNTSKAVWDKLNSLYASQSRARAMRPSRGTISRRRTTSIESPASLTTS